MRHLPQSLTILLLALTIAACSQPGLEDNASVDPPFTTSTPALVTRTPSATPTPSFTATVTATSTPTYHPMAIPALRQLDYPGSDIIIEKELEPELITTAFMHPISQKD